MISSIVCQAQLDQSLVDSLKQQIRISPADTQTVLNMIRLARHYDGVLERDSVLRYGYKVIKLSQQLDYQHGLASGHRDLGISFWQAGQLDSALHHCRRSMQAFLTDHDSLRFNNQTYLLGMIQSDYGKFDEALISHYEVLKYFDKTDNPNATAVLNSIGVVHNLLGNHQDAEEAFRRSIEIAEKADRKDALANAMSNLGDLYSDLDRLDEALTLFEQVLAYDESVNDQWGIGFQMSNIGYIYVKKENYQTALSYLLKGLAIRRQLGQNIHLCSNLILVGTAYRQMGKPSTALRYYTEAKAIAESIDARDYLYTCHVDMSKCYAALKQFEQAYAFSQTSATLRDSIYAQEKLDKIQELTKRYENEKKEAQIALLSAENQLKDASLSSEANTRKGLVLGLILLLIIGLLVWVGEKRKIRNQQLLTEKSTKIREAEFRESLTDLELKALRAQMNPHFIFNSMNSINRLILEEKNDQASHTLGKFAKLIRMILEYSEKKSISLAEELSMLDTYIQLESGRFKDRIAYEIQVDELLNPEEIEVPSMILQPFVENAIWHGLMHKEEGNGKLLIQIEARDTLLHCRIEDNGIGREKALELKNKTKSSHTSMAMAVTKERLSLLNKSGLAELIRIIDLKDVSNRALGTRVELNIPLK